MQVTRSTDAAQSPPRILFFVPGGGFQLEAMALLGKLGSANTQIILPTDSVTTDWASSFVVHRLTPIHTRARPTWTRRLQRIFSNVQASNRILRESSPDFIICVGSSFCVPMFFVARLKSIKCVFVESMARVEGLSRTGQLIEFFGLADRIYVQWPELEVAGRQRIYKGGVL